MKSLLALAPLAFLPACSALTGGERPPGAYQATLDGRGVHYEVVGEADRTLVLVHGWACDGAVWGEQRALGEEYRLLVPDLPGHGQSDAPKGDYSMDLFARAVAAV